MTTAITITLLITLGLVIIVARHSLVHFFSEDPELVGYTAFLFIFVGLSAFADGLSGYMQGPIRGLGLQKKAGYMAVASYWLLGMPLCVILAFIADLSVSGLYIGILAATLLLGMLYTIMVIRTSWQDIADAAVERIKQEEKIVA